jgi:hypothetical protein
MHTVGYALMALSVAIWLIGGRSVVKQHRRRTNTAASFPFRSPPFPWRDFNKTEKRRVRYYFLVALVLGAVGSTFVK